MYQIKNSKKQIIQLLQDVFKHSIVDIKFEDIKNFDTITEYDFSVTKIKVFYKDGIKEEIYLKMIKGGKIKETIFCYWSLLYEEFLKSEKRKNNDIAKKAIITQVTSDKSSSCIVLTLNAELNYCAEINLIELNEFCKKYSFYEGWVKSLGVKDEDILFIGKKMF